ncbi:Zn-ribbon domain-containing OB-fold protein [Amycolatopsis benzoatilytica]|uniref:Zn-ribbon domain-containing OB-fold protein n=1 Tax=Amycolatopsis benzoatilytica TaxID=346045 RepID=UPI00037E26CC|nr:OB-fold domain-containing protein [Amycolatopsis benzoatilytica]
MTSAETLPAGPAPDGADLAFWEGLRAGRLKLPRCADCGTWRALGRPVCAECWSFDLAWEEVEPEGTVYTWIRSHRAFMSELDVETPYVTVLVELTGAPVRLLGILVDASGDPAIGDRVQGVIEQPANAEWPVLRWKTGGLA